MLLLVSLLQVTCLLLYKLCKCPASREPVLRELATSNGIGRLCGILASCQGATAKVAFGILLEMSASDIIIDEHLLDSGYPELLRLIDHRRQRDVCNMAINLLARFCRSSVAFQLAAVRHGACGRLVALLLREAGEVGPAPQVGDNGPPSAGPASAHEPAVASHYQSGGAASGPDDVFPKGLTEPQASAPGAAADPEVPSVAAVEQDQLLAAKALALLAAHPGATPVIFCFMAVTWTMLKPVDETCHVTSNTH